MEIKTKFNIGDEVYFMDNNSVKFDTIVSISVFILEEARRECNVIVTQETYRVRLRRIPLEGRQVFRTRQELIESL